VKSSAPHARCLQQASGLFFFDRAATIPRPGTADFGKGDRRVTIAPGKPQGFSSQKAQPPSAFRLKTCRQYRLRGGRGLQQASGLFFSDRAATIPRPGNADFKG
jgi:hypothetical protein